MLDFSKFEPGHLQIVQIGYAITDTGQLSLAIFVNHSLVEQQVLSRIESKAIAKVILDGQNTAQDTTDFLPC